MASALPLAGLRVLDLGHTVMGPSCGLVLADLGADVIKIEPAAGDPTRNLRGFGRGYFGFFNRNKRSIAIDLKTPTGQEVVHELVKGSDILIENFAPGTAERLGLGYDRLSGINPRLVYASLKGFLAGPYENRLALDEVVQMMGGLAYMTGPSGRPLRAGTSVVDITGGIFAVVAILVALRERERSGRGQRVESSLFESTVFLVGQHLSYAAQNDGPIPPMPERVSAWAIYDNFVCADGRKIFVGLTTDNHWSRFCREVGWSDFAADPDLATNNQRIGARPKILQAMSTLAADRTLDEMCEICERARVPFAPINRPEDLFDDPHLAARKGLMQTVLPDGTAVSLPKLPVELDGVEFGVRFNPPAVGEHTIEILEELGIAEGSIEELLREGVVKAAAPRRQEEERTVPRQGGAG